MSQPKHTVAAIELHKLIIDFQHRATAARAIAEAARLKAEDAQAKQDLVETLKHTREHDVASGSARAYKSAARKVAELLDLDEPEDSDR